MPKLCGGFYVYFNFYTLYCAGSCGLVSAMGGRYCRAGKKEAAANLVGMPQLSFLNSR